MENLYVRVAFPNGNRLYTYRTPTPISKNTFVAVMAGVELKLAKVYDMTTDVDLTVDFDYKWIVQEIDLTEYRLRNAHSPFARKSRL